MRDIFTIIAIISVVTLSATGSLHGQVEVEREGAANPMATVGKATLYGTGTGLLLGSAYALATSNDNFGESLKWGFIAGAGGGFLVGVVYLFTRPQPTSSALLHFDKEDFQSVQIPKFTVLTKQKNISGIKMHLLSVNF
jgi:hypothetical protein